MMNERNPSCVMLSEPVRAAIDGGYPVVALESTIICHGMPYPDNVTTALGVEDVVRNAGATPATVAILKGKLCVGLGAEQIEMLGEKGPAVAKVSRRDLPVCVARHADGATTVATTAWIAGRAGVRVFATGGIGGVHRDVSDTMDVSADLPELARSNVAVVCAGIKSVLDIGKTLEYLETLGVPVLGYRTDKLPAFYTRSSGFDVDAVVETPGEIAELMREKWSLGLDGGLVIGNPVPLENAMEEDRMTAVIDDALQEMAKTGVRGKATTPFLLQYIATKTGGESLATNIALVRNNALLASRIAAEYARLA